MKKNWILIVLSVIIVLAIVFFVVQDNSMAIALQSKGFDPSSVCYIQKPFSDNGKEHAVLQSTADDGALSLIRTEKNGLGFWTVMTVKTDLHYVGLSWVEIADVSARTDFQMESDGRREWHYVCCGNDAMGNIELSNELLPDNTTVSIRQTGNEYTIHLISFNNEGFGDFSLRQILIDNGFIDMS